MLVFVPGLGDKSHQGPVVVEAQLERRGGMGNEEGLRRLGKELDVVGMLVAAVEDDQVAKAPDDEEISFADDPEIAGSQEPSGVVATRQCGPKPLVICFPQ